MIMKDVFFELGLEELPSGLVESLSQDLLSGVLKAFDDVHLPYGKTHVFATPRRIGFWIEGVAEQQPNHKIERRGPAAIAAHDAQGNPTPALLGFARSCKVDISALVLDTTEKGAWWTYSFEEQGAKTESILAAIIVKALKNLAIPKPMRWGSHEESFARPSHWAVLMYGEQVLPLTIFGVETGRQSYGHRFMQPQAIEISSASSYEKLLKSAYVYVDFNARKAEIVRQISEIAQQNQWLIPISEDLLHEITSIVEWPVVLVGEFDKNFLNVPAPVLIASMQNHQKCLAVYDKDEHLLPYFIAVSNIESKTPKAVQIGNEKVIRARLSDAMFFYEQDRKKSLSTYAEETEKVIFEKRLGTIADKTRRVKKLVEYLCPLMGISSNLALRAVELSKADLMTGLVSEFPELQGQVGQFYAEASHEDVNVAQALFEQYLPRFSGDRLPQTDLGYVLSLAERVDTLVGIFAIGLKPTGEKDPYKLRRHALAVVRLLLHRPNSLSIDALLGQAALAYDFLTLTHSLCSEVKQFIQERMQSYYQQQQISLEWVQAGLQVQPDDWYDLSLRLASFDRLMSSENSATLMQSAKRVRQILLQSTPDMSNIDESLMIETNEKMLWHVLKNIQEPFQQALSSKNYDGAFQELNRVNAPLAAFFEHVMVMAEDMQVRQNRLRLLQRLQQLFHSIVMIG
jgi:glycyl-tRNA synthetase beta chain